MSKKKSVTTTTTASPTKRKTPEERFRANVSAPDSKGCTNWTGCTFANGYGLFPLNGKNEYAHRYAWQIANKQPVPSGNYILHSCNNRACCNEAHLRVGTPQDNMQDRKDSGWVQTRVRGKALTPAERAAIYGQLDAGKTAYAISRDGINGRALSQQQLSYLTRNRKDIEARDAKRKTAKIISIVRPLQEALKQCVEDLSRLVKAA